MLFNPIRGCRSSPRGRQLKGKGTIIFRKKEGEKEKMKKSSFHFVLCSAFTNFA